MAASKVVLCTGGNRGLGYAILEVAGLRDANPVYLLACRKSESGRQAVEHLRNAGVKSEIRVLQLDVTNDEDVSAAVKMVEADYGKLDVLINNSGILLKPEDESLTALRETYNTLLNVNLTSVAVITIAFLPLLHKALNPKVINITSGLGSITNALTKKMGRSHAYGASKIGMNGSTMHMQTMENDRIAAEMEAGNSTEHGHIKFYVVQPGLLRTDFAKVIVPTAGTIGIDAREGAEAVVRLMMDDKGLYEGGTYWECVDGEMKQVPW